MLSLRVLGRVVVDHPLSLVLGRRCQRGLHAMPGLQLVRMYVYRMEQETQMRSILWQRSWWIWQNVNPQPALHPLDAAVGKCIKFSAHKAQCTPATLPPSTDNVIPLLIIMWGGGGRERRSPVVVVHLLLNPRAHKKVAIFCRIIILL